MTKTVLQEWMQETGDQVLRDFAQLVMNSMRANDGFYRMGGEEFVLLLRGMSEDIAKVTYPLFTNGFRA